MRNEKTGRRVRVGRANRSRWFRVRVETEGGAYVGRLRLSGPRGTLREVVDDPRAYLALWDATEEPSGAAGDFVAIHKGAIRSVVLLGRDTAPSGPAWGA